ncbi:DEAD-domain-containing protein [Rickenella mellea]|uniref:ATP-dependent RNA helicase n=1 Tax=Rickenella mellea TaxID=50990 RepID=A0A4Y7PZY0_9AGAM|nr:DEAD-domain-containing protein [Rickenella mellea]
MSAQAALARKPQEVREIARDPQPRPASPPVIPSAPVAGNNTFSALRFSDLATQGRISQKLANNIPHEFCTEVQAATIDTSLSGRDILARAKTGTGKTLSFLLPSVELLSRVVPTPSRGKISILVISPTRELAQQIAKEAEVLMKDLPYKVQTVFGGTNINTEKRRLLQERCDVLVATPGRLVDHIQNSGLRDQLNGLRTLVLDEADRLLDAGFRRELVSIIEALPNNRTQRRQTLLYSATVSAEVKKIATLALLPDHQYISTISEDEENTHQHVKQEYIVAPFSDTYAITAKYLTEAIGQSRAAGEDEKIIVFLPTARSASLMYELVRRNWISRPPESFFPVPVLQIHSRMSQPARMRATEDFRKLPSAVLFSSDVTARGMDFQGIGYVVQVGVPANAEQYIHRLGRTARVGREGQGLLIISPDERFFLRQKEVRDLPLVEHPQSNTLIGPALDPWRQLTASAMSRVPEVLKAQTYSAFLGYYKTFSKGTGWSAAQLVAIANEFALRVLLYRSTNGKPPGLLAKTVGMMGLRGTPGLNVVKALEGGDGSIGGGR